jgi:hypothetical protein
MSLAIRLGRAHTTFTNCCRSKEVCLGM